MHFLKLSNVGFQFCNGIAKVGGGNWKPWITLQVKLSAIRYSTDTILYCLWKEAGDDAIPAQVGTKPNLVLQGSRDFVT